MRTSIDIRQSRITGRLTYRLCIQLAREWHHDLINGSYPSRTTCRLYRDKYLSMARVLKTNNLDK